MTDLNFYENFKLRFLASGISRRELACKVNISEASICRYLNGERTPSESHKALLIEALGYNEETFYKGDPVDIKQARFKDLKYSDILYLLRYKLKSLTKDEKKTLIKVLEKWVNISI